jgi:hypothetical protein
LPGLRLVENFGRHTDGIPSFVTEVRNRFAVDGLSLDRVGIVMRALYPQIAVSGYMWRDGVKELAQLTGDHQP